MSKNDNAEDDVRCSEQPRVKASETYCGSFYLLKSKCEPFLNDRMPSL